MAENWTVRSILDWTTGYFERGDIESPRLDAEVLLAEVMGCPRLNLFLLQNEEIPPDRLAKFKAFIAERYRRRPIAYILGKQEFMGLEFAVTADTLIPRPETELLVEEILGFVKEGAREVLADLCTGSGNIAVSAAKLSDVRRVYACDINTGALAVAWDNAVRHGAAGKVFPRHGDLFEALTGEGLEGQVDLIASNPPYIAQDELPGLAPELGFEPRLALDGGPDGLGFYRRLAAGGRDWLRPGGKLVVEMSAVKAAAIQDIFRQYGYTIRKVVKDYAGLDRVAVAEH